MGVKGWKKPVSRLGTIAMEIERLHKINDDWAAKYRALLREHMQLKAGHADLQTYCRVIDARLNEAATKGEPT